MLNDELKPNFAELLRTSANLSAPTAGWGAEFCSCVESVLAIGYLQLQKGVLGAGRHIEMLCCLRSEGTKAIEGIYSWFIMIHLQSGGKEREGC